MAVKRNGLGRGLDSLIPRAVAPAAEAPAAEAETTQAAKKGKAEQKNAAEKKASAPKKAPAKEKTAEKTPVGAEIMVKIGKVEPNRSQPRKHFDDEALAELTESIRIHGVIQPLIVKDVGSHYEIIAGERRWRAARQAGLKEVPVVIRDYSDAETLQVSLIENLQREDLNPIEEALAYDRLSEEFKLTHEEIADRVSKSRTAVTNALRLLKLPETVKKMVEEGSLSAGHARALLALEDDEKIAFAAEHVSKERLSVRQTEELVKKLQQPAREPVSPAKEDVQTALFYKEMERKLSEKVSAKVKIRRGGGDGGKIEITYTSLDELERLGDLLER